MLEITKLFTGGTLEGLTYVMKLRDSERNRSEYVGFMEIGRIFNHPGFGSPYKIVSVEAVAIE